MSELVANVLRDDAPRGGRASRSTATGMRSARSSARCCAACASASPRIPCRSSCPRELPLVRVDADADRAGARQPAGERGRSTRRPARRDHAAVEPRRASCSVSVEDDGPGLPPGDPERAVRQVPARRAGGRGRRRRPGPRHLPRDRRPARRADLGRAAAARAARRSASPCRWRRAPQVPRGMTEPQPTILVVEDEPEIRRFLRSSLGAEGYRVVEAETGERGAIDAGTHKPDLAIVDLGLPDIDGVEVIRRIRALVADADPGAVGARAGARQDRGARRRRRRLRHQALRRRRAARARARRAAPRGAARRRGSRPPFGEVERRSREAAGAPRRQARCISRRSSSGCSPASPSTSAWWSRTASCCAKSGGPRTSSTPTTCAST